MVDSLSMRQDAAGTFAARDGIPVGGSQAFWISKRAFDLCVATAAIPVVILVGVALLLLNPFWNPGPLLHRQERMARGCCVMAVWKFRTMLEGARQPRGPEDPVERDRITPLGRWLRRTRLDELPQLLNVVLGQMSLIGPRPDVIEHARAFIETVPDYSKRYVLRPGISGLAQVNLGYAEGAAMTTSKTRYDLDYIRNAGWRQEAILIWMTLAVMFTGFGAR